MTTPPNFPPFQPAIEKWTAYINRFECVLAAANLEDIPPSRKKAYFLSFCGPVVFEIATALLAPRTVKAVTWEELQEALSNHYAPKPSRVARRHAFRRRIQGEGETINDYIAALHSTALQCNFRDQRELDDMLLDQLICGVKDRRLQRRLLAKRDIDLNQAIEEAQAAEMSTTSAAELLLASPLGGKTSSTVHSEEAVLEEEEEEEEETIDRIRNLLRSQRKNTPVSKKQPTPQLICLSCGGNHLRNTCRFRNVICLNCHKKGHLAKVCQAPRSFRQPKQAINLGSKEDCFAINNGNYRAESLPHALNINKINVNLLLEGAPCRMEVDTGSALSILSWKTLKDTVPGVRKKQLQPCQMTLRDYQGQTIPVLGTGKFHIDFKQFQGQLPLVIVNGDLPSLLGLDWFHALGLQITGINSIVNNNLPQLLEEFAEVFEDTLGCYKGTPISLNLDPKIAPIRLKPRRVPLALKTKVDTQLDKLIAQGVLEPIDFAKWETPIVIPLKKDGSVRICSDYKSTINKALQPNAYPVPIIQHLLHSLGGNSIFTKLDMTQAYQQFPVDNDTAEAQTIVTHRGAFRCRRLQFGVSVAPGIFQSIMERLLYNIEGVIPYFDDILIAADTPQDHHARLKKVLQCFKEAGLKLNKKKCIFAVNQIDFLGYHIDKRGIHPMESKARAIQEAPTPKTKSELQAFLGLLNFYNSFLPHKATVAEPLHRLLDSKATWGWGAKEQKSFEAIKALLTSANVLMQFNKRLPLVLVCDASPYGIGAVLGHRLPNGQEAPVAYFSRTLSKAERNYSQLDKEALAAVASVKKFHEYLYGHQFELITDHKPLLGILAGDKPSPQILSPRMTRWSIFLAAYSYHLTHRPGKDLAHADALSRCPLSTLVTDPAPDASVFLLNDLQLPLTADDIALATHKDEQMAIIKDWIQRGWPRDIPGDLQPFKCRQTELSVLKGCVLWGSRVVIPKVFRPHIIDVLHEGHPGINRMKALARSYVWWPGLDEAVSNKVQTCHICQSSRPAPPAATPGEWEDTRTPWSRVHIDLAGPLQGKKFLILVDSFSKWIELVILPTTTSEAVSKALEKLFATHGYPDTLVSDNGPQFTSSQFKQFLALKGIRHALTSPFHPASNGCAERAVRSAKEALGRMEGGDWDTKVNQYLLGQHSTPSAATNLSPAELLMGHRIRITLDRLHPNYTPKAPLDSSSRLREFLPGDLVYSRNYTGRPLWLPGVIEQRTGPKSYRVRVTEGRVWHRHVDQLRSRWSTPAGPQAMAADDDADLPGPGRPSPGLTDPDLPTPDLPRREAAAEVQEPGPDAQRRPPATRSTGEQSPASTQAEASRPASNPAPSSSPPAGELRRSACAKRRPTYLKDYACAGPGGKSVVCSQVFPQVQQPSGN